MRWLGIVVAVIVGLAVLYKLKYPAYVYRYRMTVEVQAGSETRAGSSVIEVKVSRQPQFLPEVGPLSQSAKGQAVFIELPGGKNIVALLTSGARAEHGDFPIEVVPRQFNLNFLDNRTLSSLQRLHGRRELGVDRMPTLVTLANPNDSTTVQVLRPDQLDQALGAHLRLIVVEMTKDPVTPFNIESRLPFLVGERQKRGVTDVYPDRFIPNYPYFLRD